jgi:hypothetical protein
MKNLFKKLAAFQQEVPVIHKGTQGYGYSYANLSTIFEVINPLLKKHGLGFTQLVGDNNVKTIIFDIESGENIETVTTIPSGVTLKGMNDFQILGSAITYVRRYSLSSALGLITDKDIDGGGEQVKPVASVSKPTLTEQVETAKAKIINASSIEDLTAKWQTLTKLEQSFQDVIELSKTIAATFKTKK